MTNIINADLFNNLISFFVSPSFSGWLFIIRIVFLVLSLILGVAVILLISKNSYYRYLLTWDLQEILSYRPFGVKRIEKEWNLIKTRLDTGLESEYKLAVIEADNKLEDVLKRMGYPGESLGDRLEKITPNVLSNLEEIKQCHQTRNNIIHDPSYRLTIDEARRLVAVYEKAFQNLEVF